MMGSRALYSLLLAVFLSCAWASPGPTATIEGRLRLPDDSPVNTTRIVLNNGDQLTYSRIDGSFTLYNVPPGIHLLDVHSHQYMFSQIKIQLLEESMDSPKCIEYMYPGAKKQSISHPLVLTAHASYMYFEPPPSFSVFSLLKNPMMLMMIFGMGLMFLMPKMMEGMEPEEKERMQQQMKMQKEMQSDPTKMLSSLFGMGNDEPQQPVSGSKKKK